MKNVMSRGFTLIELMIVIAIIGIVVAIALPAIFRSDQNQASPMWNDPAQYSTPSVPGTSQCVNGYMVLGNGSQMLNERGGGVPCK